MSRLIVLMSSLVFFGCSTESKVQHFAIKNTKEYLPVFNFDKAPTYGKIPRSSNSVDILNHIFTSDINTSQSLLILTNKTSCDFVMEIIGDTNYTKIVPSGKTESILVEKGNYKLSSKICDLIYNSQKALFDNTEVTIKIN